MKMTNKFWMLGISTVAVLVLTASSCSGESDAVREDRKSANANLERLQQAQPAPEFDRSQIRQNLIEINTAQAEGSQTTSFFFNLGSENPIMVCPSIGYPIPTTAQLTNPDQKLYNSSGAVVGQAEQTGIYTGESTGTYVLCVNDDGEAFAQYWEGFVSTSSGPAQWNAETKMIELTGSPSFDFSEPSK